MSGYAVAFFVALIARALSTGALAMQRDVRPPLGEAEGSNGARFRLALGTAQWRTACFLACLMFGAHVSVPFFTPYMLRVLELDYAQFAILTSTSIAAKTLTFSGCHRLGTRFGLRALLIVGGAGVAVVPVCWTLSRNFIELTIVHVLSGAAWALLEYASFQLLLASAPTRVRLQFLSMASCLSGLCQLVGSLVGAELLERFALSYDDLFAVSSVLRAIPLLLFVPTLPYSRVTELPRLLLRIFSVRPGTGSVERPLLPSTPPPPPRP
jgi:hypothetical protein